MCLLTICAACAAPRQDSRDPLVGTWRGNAVFRGSAVDLTIRFYRESDSLRATLSSADLLLLEQPLHSVSHVKSHVRFTTPDEHPVHFDGMLRGDSIAGSAPVPAAPGVVEERADHQTMRFVLFRSPDSQPPPYATREVCFESTGTRLAGSIFVPSARAGRHPGIVLLQGSSSNLRTEYRFYSDHFARAGFTVLMFDKRGSGGSSGEHEGATYDDLVADASAAVGFLRKQPEVVSEEVGIWGLSQGAFIAPLVAARAPSLAFIVAVSPPGVTIGESAAYQDSVRLLSKGFSTEDAARAAIMNRQVLGWLQSGQGGKALTSELARYADSPWRRASSLPAQLPAGAALRGWYWGGRTLDPIPGWRALRVPVVVVFGAADKLIPAEISAAKIEEALREGGHPDFTVRVYPAANHVLRRLPLVAGGAWAWPKAAPGYLDFVTGWILERVKG